MRSLDNLIEENLARSSDEVQEKLSEVNMYHQVEIPPGERAIYAVPRDYDWQLPQVEDARHHAQFHGDESRIPPDNRPVSMVMRHDKLWIDQSDVGYHLFPQQLIVHKNVTDFLQEKAGAYMVHCPEETTWTQKHLGAAAAIGRWDVAIHPDGRIGIGELDLEASLWGNAHEYNQIAETHILGLFDRIKDRGYEAVSTEFPEIRDTQRGAMIGQIKTPDGRTRFFGHALSGEYGSESYAYHYQHNDSGMYGTNLPFVAPEDLTDEHVAITRGRRRGTYYAPDGKIMDFGTYMEMVEKYSLIPGRLRDCKVPLAAMGMGVLATREHAFEAIEAMIRTDPDMSFAIKQAMAARTADMAIVRRKSGRRRQGERTISQARERMSRYEGGYDDLVVVQPAFEHPSMADLGLEFRPTDREDLMRYPHVAAGDVERLAPGQESSHGVIARIFVRYDKTQPEFAKLLGGVGAALPGRIVHNDKRAAVFSIFCEGVDAYPDVIPYYSLEGEKRGDVANFENFHRRIANCALQVLRSNASV